VRQRPLDADGDIVGGIAMRLIALKKDTQLVILATIINAV